VKTATPRLRDDPDALAALIAATAAHRDLNPAFVEKDFWVTEVLRAVVAPRAVLAKDQVEHQVTPIFKGGTSLNKGWGLIDRFSEDVDLLIPFPDNISTKGRDTFLKDVIAAARAHLGLGDAGVRPEGAATTGVKRNVRFMVPSRYDDPAVTAGVLLEMGSRGGRFPTATRDLTSLVAEHATTVMGAGVDEQAEFQPVRAVILATERTLLEKVALLHDAACRYAQAPARLDRAGRHLYDVQRLLQHTPTIQALRALGPDGRQQIWEDIARHSEAAGFPFTARPAAGIAASPLLDPALDAHKAARHAYTAALGLVYGSDVPTFEDCIAALAEHAELL
jgi:hypothetical protein